MIRHPLALAGVLLLASSAVHADDLHVVAQTGRMFHPGEISIRPGEWLTISNRDDFIHQIYVKSDAMNFDSDEQPPGQNVSVNFPAAGSFEVRCHIHPKMSLTVHVR